MFIYTKYILKHLVSQFLLLLLVLIFITWITQVIRLLPLIDQGINIIMFFKFTLLLIPSLLFMILPITLTLSTIYVYCTLQNDRQLLILANAGLSNFSITKPALILSVCITIIAYYLSFYLMPVSYNHLKEELSDFKENYITNVIEARVFNSISKTWTIYADSKNSDNSLNRVMLFDHNDPKNKRTLFANYVRTINLEKNNLDLELFDGLRHAYDKYGNITKLSFTRLVISITNNKSYQSIKNKNSNQRYIHEMIWPDDVSSTKRKNHFFADGHARIVWPIFNITLVLCILSVFLNQTYDRKSNTKQIIIALIPGIISIYVHFTLQKILASNIEYISLFYVNIFLCVMLIMWQNSKSHIYYFLKFKMHVNK